MAHKTMTFGEMPSREEYDAAWDALEAQGELRDGMFHFGNDKRLGTCALTSSELWRELQRASREYAAELEADDQGEDPEAVGDWMSCVLSCLGFEWV